MNVGKICLEEVTTGGHLYMKPWVAFCFGWGCFKVGLLSWLIELGSEGVL